MITPAPLGIKVAVIPDVATLLFEPPPQLRMVIDPSPLMLIR